MNEIIKILQRINLKELSKFFTEIYNFYFSLKSLTFLSAIGIAFLNPLLSQSKAYTLLIGMDIIDNKSYLHKYQKEYDNEGTVGVYKDIAAIKRITQPDGHIITELRGINATREAILKEIEEIGKKVKSGDQFFLYYSGHGDLIPDKNGDEKSGFDQAMVVYDDFLIDDEIDRMLMKYFTLTRNIMIVDACHSGSSYKINNFFMDFPLWSDKKNKFFGEVSAFKQQNEISTCQINTEINEPYNLLYFGATPDNNLAQGDQNGGLLTKHLNIIVRDAKIRGDWNKYNYEKLACELSKVMKKKGQSLQFLEAGKSAQTFAQLIPFKN